MLAKLEQVESRFEELNNLLADPSIMSDRDRYRDLTKEHFDLEPIVKCFREWRHAEASFKESKEILDTSSDAELRELAALEMDELRESVDRLYRELMILLLPKDPNDEKNVILEIRAGTGGDESALFASELFDAYCRYSERRGWKVELMSTSESSVGGFKEVIARIDGRGAYSRLKYERGVHRVQRVPKTETQGRIHTSTITVAVLPEAEEVDIEILDKDLRVDVFRSSGPGGQSVNTTDSAVRIVHKPTGIVVECQDERSQIKNKEKAMKILKSRMLEKAQREQQEAISADRKSQVGSGDRSERIRTYNFPQGRLTDHRINLTLYKLDDVMNGDIGEILDALGTNHQQELLQQDMRTHA